MQKVGSWTNLRRWIYREGYAIKKGDGTKRGSETHLFLNGGRCEIPDEKNAQFLSLYARSLFEDDWVYVVEKKTTPIFYFMNEFDIKIRDREMTRDELDRIVRIVQRVMSSAFPGRDVRLAVCTAESKPATLDDGTPVIQSGLHLLWRVTVDGETAWQLRAWILRALEAEMTDMPLATRWAEAFDDCIFRLNGLRMLGSRKAIICPQCKGQSYKREGRDDDEWGTVCSGCQDIGRIDLGRPYSLLYVAGPDGAPDEEFTLKLKRDPMALVLFTTIRAINPDGTRPNKAMEIAFPDAETKATVIADAKRDKSQKKHDTKAKKGPQKDAVAVKDADAKAKKKQERRDSLEDLSPDTLQYPAISEYIRNEFNGLPNVIGIKKGGSGDFYIVNSDCHYCYNKGGMHNHSSVFYVLRPKGCVQRCFCPKDIVQPAGGKRCSAYVSKAHPVPSDLQELIFSEGVLRTRRREERRAKLAAEVFASTMQPPPPPASVPQAQAQAAVEEEEDEDLDALMRIAEAEAGVGTPPPGPEEEEELGMPPPAPAPQAQAQAPRQQQAHQEARRDRRFDPRTVMVVRPGTEYKYKDSRDAIKPIYTSGDFLNAMKNANYKIL